MNEYIITEHINKENLQKRIIILFNKKKGILLNLIRNIVKYYGNISEIYDKDNDKKIKLIKINTERNFLN